MRELRDHMIGQAASWALFPLFFGCCVSLWAQECAFGREPKTMTEIFAFAVDTGVMAGTGNDEYLTYPGAPIGSGQMPGAPFTIVGVDLTNDTDDDSAYAVIGHTGPNGDYISQKNIGPSRLPALMYPPGYGFAFDPSTDELHLHWSAQPGSTAHIYATVFYMVP